jgi:eukaryotic-like serine/threonine-protein kinase
VYEVPHGTLTRITFDGNSVAPLWTPDGKRITFLRIAGPGGRAILSKAADGTGAEETLLGEQNAIQLPYSWSPDGMFLAYVKVSAHTGRDIAILPLKGDQSDESGKPEVYVQRFPGPGGKWQVSTDGGSQPLWARNGRELFYQNLGKLISVSVTTQPTFSASTPRFVADVPPLPGVHFGNTTYDVSLDGQRFLFAKTPKENAPPSELRVVLNWAEELKRLAPTSKEP